MQQLKRTHIVAISLPLVSNSYSDPKGESFKELIQNLKDVAKELEVLKSRGYSLDPVQLQKVGQIDFRLFREIAAIENSSNVEQMESGRQIDPETELVRQKSVNDFMSTISTRTHNCLKNANLKTSGQIADMTSRELLKLKNFGRVSLNEVKEDLSRIGLTLQD